jgi:hypothetical protein
MQGASLAVENFKIFNFQKRHGYLCAGEMKITHNLALNFQPVFIPFNQPLRAILDFEFWIVDLLYRFALSFFIKLICRLPARRAYSSERGRP